MTDSTAIIEIESPRVLPLRTEILAPQLLPDDYLRYDGDDEGHHFAVVERDDADEHLLAVVTYLLESPPQGAADIRLRGLAVDPRRRGQDLDSMLLRASLPRIALLYPTARYVWCAASPERENFFRSHGFHRFRDDLDDDSVALRRKLPTVIA